ncbi:MAG TPA: histidine kinase [Puia sp.]
MKRKLLILLSFLAIYACRAQNTGTQSGRKSIKFYLDNQLGYGQRDAAMGVYMTQSVLIRDTALYDYFSSIYSLSNTDKNSIGLGLVTNKNEGSEQLTGPVGNPVRNGTKEYLLYPLKDTAEVEIITMGITPANKKQFEYRVVENDSFEIKRWQTINTFRQEYGAKKPYGVIGKFRQTGKQLLIEVRKKNNFSIRDGIYLDWRPIAAPKIIWGMVEVARSKGATEMSSIFNSSSVTHPFVQEFDKVSGLAKDLKIPAGMEGWEFFPGTWNLKIGLSSHIGFPYEVRIKNLAGNNQDDLIINPEFTGQILEIPGKFFSQAGKYELTIQNRVGGSYIVIPFSVLPPPFLQKKATLKQILLYTVAALAGIGLLFLVYYRNNKRQLARSARSKQTMNLQLQSIRSQLNPHFMFNALSSIQNLMNKNDIAGANHYLAKFADLARKVLHSGNQEMISLEDELKILEDYLQMEQLRFGFEYKIKADETINIANTEVPAMLLQPFVENAVKHGVTALQKSGMIEIDIGRQNKDLVLTVSDNGKGFERNRNDHTRGDHTTEGFGLKLSGERVELLNKIYKTQPTTLEITSQPSGTTIMIKLENWI